MRVKKSKETKVVRALRRKIEIVKELIGLQKK